MLQHHKHEIAALLEGTRSDRYSFHYADLDPRAFQRFYEDTIGTDIRLAYHPEDGDEGRVDVGVVYRDKNRKEQGAFYTHEKMARWLVEQSLGQLYEDWKDRFLGFLQEEADEPAGRLPKLRSFLDELLDWRIIDPTCGGGIFLRAAFEYLDKRRDDIEEMLDVYLPDQVHRELTEEEPYSMFRTPEGDGGGEWQWYVLLNMLYGVDEDVKAINVASNLLTLSAITYKRHGVSFPSFVNLNLKRGNALVVPLEPDQREEFTEAWGDEIQQLIDLRRRLRDPDLPRNEWRELHEASETIARQVLHAQIVLAFDDVFPDLDHEDLIRRVLRVGAFLYEIEFPEVFFDEDGTWKDEPGFDVVLGNPPWEEPAKELKHFLPQFDPAYKDLKGQEAEAREEELLSDPEIERQWESFKESVDDYKELLRSSIYEYQRVPVDGEVPSAHDNLYKYATELAHKLLKEGGEAGLVLDAGLWSDLSAKGIRQLLIDQGRLDTVLGFKNREKIFPDVVPQKRFACTSFGKTGATDEIEVLFRCEQIDVLNQFEEKSFEIEADPIRNDSSDAYPISEVSSRAHWQAERALQQHPSLNEEPWDVETYSREFNAGEQRHFFHEERREGFYPLVQGTQFNLFGVHQGELPEFWLDPSEEEAGGFLRDKQEKRILLAIGNWLEQKEGYLSGGKKAAGRDWLEAQTGEPEVPDEWMTLDWDGYRIAWRDVARNDDRRTLITTIIPPRVGLSDKAPFIRPFELEITSDRLQWSLRYPHQQLLYLAGMLSSFCCDSLARTRVAKTTLSATTFRSFEVPAWNETSRQCRVAELTARLTCLPADDERPWVDYTELADAVGLTPEDDGIVDSQARREAKVELNALACEIYGLESDAFEFLMDELFMTPEHEAEHKRMRDDIVDAL